MSSAKNNSTATLKKPKLNADLFVAAHKEPEVKPTATPPVQKSEKQYITLGASVPVTLKKKLKMLAADKGCRMQDLIQSALVEYLERNT